MLVKREASEDVYGVVLQDPRDRVRTALFKPQSPAMQANIPRLQRLLRGHPDRAAKSSSLEPSAGWAVGNDPTQGDGQGTYVALARLMLRECGMARRAARRRVTEGSY